MAMPATKAQDSKSGQKLTHLRGATAMLSCHSCADSEVSESSSSETEESESERPKKLSAEEKVKAAQVLDKHLGPLSYLFTNHAIHKFFRKYAGAKTLDGRKAIAPHQVARMAPALAEYLEVPPVLFRQVEVVCERFDFDGSGVLDKKQCTMMFRNILRHKRKQLGPRHLPIEVPEMSLSSSGYVVQHELGRGGQGVMYLCTLEEVPYCIKFFSKADGDEDCLEDLLTEYTLMRDFSHKNVAKTFEVFQDSEFFYLVNEPYFGGDLTKIAKRAHDQGLCMSESWWRLLFQQCLEGLEYLHAQAVMHCDIKEENIMVAGKDCEEPRVVLIDFGLAEGFLSTSSGCSGTAGYIPPETWETELWYPKGDVFSMGIVFFQLMIGQVPNGEVMGVLQTSGKSEQDKAAGIALNLPWQRFPPQMLQLAALVASMTHREMQYRPSAAAALKHDWFTCESDEDFPAGNRAALIGSSASQTLREQVTYELASKNNLHELRELKESLQDLSKRIKKENVATKDAVVEVLLEYGVRTGCTQEYAHVCGTDGFLDYSLWIDQALRLREQYTSQFLQDLFLELDYDEQGHLSRRQVESLLNSGAVECENDEVEEILQSVSFDDSGFVAVGTVRALMLKDGRIARRSQVFDSKFCHDCPRMCQIL